MRPTVFVLVAVGALAGAVAYLGPASAQTDREAAPIFGIKMPAGYRDWRLISVAHEEGNLNDLRAILGNDVAIKASQEGKLPFPDGTIIARLAGLYLIVSDIEAARAELVDRGVEVSELFHDVGGVFPPRRTGIWKGILS